MAFFSNSFSRQPPTRPFASDMTVCKFYQQGNCKFGDNCRFEHPGANRNTNRFGALSGQGDRYQPPRGGFGGGMSRRAETYRLTTDEIKHDLTGDKPIWPFSAYGAGRDAPRQLIEGPLEISPEELRLRYYAARAAGNEAVAQQEEAALLQKMNGQIKSILDDLDGACQYVEDGEKDPNNRNEIAKRFNNSNGQFSIANQSNRNQNGTNAPSGFGAQQNQNNPFGKPAAPSFGQSGFSAPGNQNNQTQNSAFGQPSPMNQGSSFGKPAFSQPGGGSGFGQPSSLGGNPAFGRPAFGQPAGGSAFGQPSGLGANNSPFAQNANPAQTNSAFGKPSTPGQTAPAFGSSSALGQGAAFGKPAFGQPAFGQSSTPASTASPFSQQQKPNPFGGGASGAPAFGQSPFSQQQQQQQPQPQNAPQQQPPSNPFGQPQPAAPSSTFNQPQPTAPTSTFSQPSPFSQAAQKPSPFSQPSAPAATPAPSAFAAPAAPAASPFPTAAPASQPAQPSPLANGAPPINVNGTSSSIPSSADPSTYITTNPQGAVSRFKGSPVAYFDNHPYRALSNSANPNKLDDHWERIWLPKGRTIDANSQQYMEGTEGEYTGQKGQAIQAAYRIARETGQFPVAQDGPLKGFAVLPEVPPRLDWVDWAL